MSSANRANFTSSFLILMPFISFSCLIALTRSSRTVLNRSSESGHPCLVLDLKGKAFNLSSLNMMLAVGLWYMTFISLRYVPSLSNFFLSWTDIEFCQMLFFYWDDHMIFFFHSMYTMYHIYWFAHVEPSLHPSNNPTWS